MSEFKYACPVCGQHISCDSSQAGTQMECPTCFQKIIVPQAPATDDPKFIITGTQVGGERPMPKVPEANPYAAAPSKSFPGAAIVVILLIFIGAAVAFVYRGTIFNPAKSQHGGQTAPANRNKSAEKKSPPKPALVAPPANDTNWTLNLDGVTIPDSTAAGRIGGQDFICQRAIFQGGYLTLRDGDLSLAIHFGNATAETLDNKSLNVTTNAASAARVNLRWKNGEFLRASFTNGYALRLDFGDVKNNRVPGKIYFCAPDETKSYVAGTFTAEIRKPRPKKQ